MLFLQVMEYQIYSQCGSQWLTFVPNFVKTDQIAEMWSNTDLHVQTYCIQAGRYTHNGDEGTKLPRQASLCLKMYNKNLPHLLLVFKVKSHRRCCTGGPHDFKGTTAYVPSRASWPDVTNSLQQRRTEAKISMELSKNKTDGKTYASLLDKGKENNWWDWWDTAGTAVAQWLRRCATNRMVDGSIPAGISGFFIDIKSFRSHYGPGVDSASNRNEYQEHFWG